MKDVPGVDSFRAFDFGEHPFSEQMRIVHNTSILVGMHGGGLFHTLSMDTDRRVSVIELYPKRWADGRGPTIGHIAKLLGIRHRKLESTEPASVQEIKKRGTGTLVPATELRELVASAAAWIRAGTLGP